MRSTLQVSSSRWNASRVWSRVSAAVASQFRRLAPAPRVQVMEWPQASFFPDSTSLGTPVDAHAVARFSNSRSWLPAFVQDARQDISPGDRVEIIRKARYFEQTNALVQKILDLIETNVVGSGINPTPMSSSDRFNARALEWWNEWCSKADLTSRQHFYALQAIMARAAAVDGEIFVFLTTGEDGKYPRVQLIESHRVLSAGIPVEKQNGQSEFDGIVFDARGRPLAYVVTFDRDALSTQPPTKVARIPAERMVHIFEPSRAGQPRGLSLFAACLHDIHDLDDLQIYEMMASKDAAERVRTVYNQSAQPPPAGGTVFERAKTVTLDNGTTEQRSFYYQRSFGGRTVYMHTGDKAELEEPLRPTVAQREFWMMIERKICRATGISYAAVTDYEGNWGGAALRGAITSDNRFYDVRTQNLTGGLETIYRYVMGFAVRSGELGRTPADWWRVHFQSPRRATVDIGRESKAILEELRGGIRTERDILGELGLDFNEVRVQRIAEVTARLEAARELGKEFKLPVMTAYTLLAQPPSGIYAAALADVEEGETKPGAGAKNNPTAAPAATP